MSQMFLDTQRRITNDSQQHLRRLLEEQRAQASRAAQATPIDAAPLSPPVAQSSLAQTPISQLDLSGTHLLDGPAISQYAAPSQYEPYITINQGQGQSGRSQSWTQDNTPLGTPAAAQPQYFPPVPLPIQQTQPQAPAQNRTATSPVTPITPAGQAPVSPIISNTSPALASPYQERENALRAMQLLNAPFPSQGYVQMPHNIDRMSPLEQSQAMGQYNTALAHSMSSDAARQANSVNMLGEMMRNQVDQGRLGVARDAQSLANEVARGTGGVGGSIENSARDSQSLARQRDRENERFGDEARYDALYQNLLGQFPPGTSPDVRVRRLRERGFAPPRYMGAQGTQHGASQGSSQATSQTTPQTTPLAGVQPIPGSQPLPRVNPDLTPTTVNTPEVAIENALSNMPVDATTGVRQRPEPGSAAQQRAITQALASMPNNVLQANWPAMQQQLIDTFGTDALDQWINQPNSYWATMGMVGREQQNQVNRLLRMANMQTRPYTPFSPGQSFMHRLGTFVNPIQMYRIGRNLFE